MKPAFVVVAHQSKDHRPNGHELIYRYLTSLEENLKIPYDVFIIDNASETKFQSDNRYHYHYLPDQEKGLVRSWNLGVYMAIENGNDIISVTNDDVYFNDTLPRYFEIIDSLEDDVKNNSVFGPVCDTRTTFPNQYAETTEDLILDISSQYDSFGMIHGWFMTFSKEYFQKYQIEGNLFDPEKKWRGQEKFQYRDRKKGNSRSLVIKSCMIHHDHIGGWKKFVK